VLTSIRDRVLCLPSVFFARVTFRHLLSMFVFLGFFVFIFLLCYLALDFYIKHACALVCTYFYFYCTLCNNVVIIDNVIIIEPFGYDNSPMRAPSNLLQHMGQFPHLPRKEGDEAKNPISGHENCSTLPIAGSPFRHSLKYKAGGYSASPDTHSQVPVLSSYPGLTVAVLTASVEATRIGLYISKVQ